MTGSWRRSTLTREGNAIFSAATSVGSCSTARSCDVMYSSLKARVSMEMLRTMVIEAASLRVRGAAVGEIGEEGREDAMWTSREYTEGIVAERYAINASMIA